MKIKKIVISVNTQKTAHIIIKKTKELLGNLKMNVTANPLPKLLICDPKCIPSSVSMILKQPGLKAFKEQQLIKICVMKHIKSALMMVNNLGTNK